MKPENKIEKREPFMVPEGYFESLTDRIIESINESDNSTEDSGKIKTFPHLRNKYMAIAAIIAGVAIITAGILRYAIQPSAGFTRQSLPKETLAEDLDIWTIENEIIESGSTSYGSTGTTYDLFESMVIENVEETDIYEL